MAKRRVAQVPASSTTGIAHDLLFELLDDGRGMVTVLGADGRKRHASSVVATLSDAIALRNAAEALIDAIANRP